MRRGRYKKNILTPEQCPVWAQAFIPKLQDLLLERKTLGLSDAEFVGRYLEVGLQTAELLKKGSRWNSNFLIQEGSLQIWSTTLFRGIPESVNHSLLAWQSENFPLHLCEHVPSTEEVLHWQTLGERCVTCVTNERDLSSYILGERDALSFVLHDLIHADHFFRDPVMAQVQVGFSRLMKDLILQPEIQKLRQSDETFLREFDYGSTDMNSHGAHLLKYLKAILVFALERHGEMHLDQWLSDLLENIQIPASAALCFLRLNTAAETTDDFQSLQDFLFEKGALENATARQNQEHRGVVIS